MEIIRKPKNLTDLTDDLADLFVKLRKNEYPLNQAKEINNTAGKMIKSVATQIAFQSLVKTKNDIPFAH